MSAAIEHNFNLAPTAPDEPRTEPAQPGSHLAPLVVPDSSPASAQPGSHLAPLVVPDSPVHAGSRLDPFVLGDSPPRRRLRFNKGPPSTIDPSTPLDLQIGASNDLQAIRNRIQYLETAKVMANGAARIDTLSDRISALRARLPTTSSGHSAPMFHAPRSLRGTGSRAILALEAELIGSRRSTENTRALAGPSRTSNTSRDLAGVISSRAATRVTRRASASGWRAERHTALTYKNLWVGGRGPSEQVAHPDKEHHSCSICQFVKSHPVSYRCGHSHCYACIRLWLEREWTCPECNKIMHEKPFRHYGEESNLASEYTEWRDRSQVDYSFEGLRFPRRVAVDSL